MRLESEEEFFPQRDEEELVPLFRITRHNIPETMTTNNHQTGKKEKEEEEDFRFLQPHFEKKR